MLLHQDKSSPLAVVNVLYDVGSRDEDPNRTGFAHLFEHLMFGGSLHIDDFDTPIQNAGGDNNAFTNSDVTNFYNTVPKANIETALWLESDRMLQLNFNQHMLDVQKKVVVEEFKESINVPYGDMWHELSKLCYKKHPYQWPTIGKDFGHIEQAALSDVEHFFNKHYHPNNAILCISGNIEYEETFEKVQKWFGPIPPGIVPARNLPQEVKQDKKRQLIKQSMVPRENLNIAYHMVDRAHPDYYVFDLISDLLSLGRSSRLYKNLVKTSDVFNSLGAYISGSMDPGLFIIDAKISLSAHYGEAIEKIDGELNKIRTELVSDYELVKIKNKIISVLEFSEVSILNKAINLSHFELLGNADLINEQSKFYEAVTAEDIKRVAENYLVESNSNVLIYLPNAN